MRKYLSIPIFLGLAGVGFCAMPGDASPHMEQTLGVQPSTELSDDQIEMQSQDAGATTAGRRAAEPTIDDNFIVLGYIQSEAVVFHYRWNALTHVASTFNTFDSTGNLNSSGFTGRSSLLKAGGAAEDAGVKVLLTVLNSGFNVNVINDVMTNATARNELISDIVATVTGDGYCAGVTFDFEPFSWSSAARDGMTIFFEDLRAALPPPYEISIYADAIPSSTQWDIPGIEPNIDYLIYSAYDWATGITPHAITDFNNTISHTRALWYLDQGLPPEKFVYAFSTYGRRWKNTTEYDDPGDEDLISGTDAVGFTDGLFDTTLNTNNGGPFTNNYVTGDEGAWYTFNVSGTDKVITWESPEAVRYKVANVLSTQDTTTAWRGRRLGGVAFWSLVWLAEQSSYDMRTNTSVSRSRTYPHVYQILQETLATPGQEWFIIESWEGDDPRWRDPNFAPDTSGDTDSNSTESIAARPGGAGAPADSTNAALVFFDFENASGNKLVYAHEVLSSPLVTSIRDTNAVAAVLSSNMKLRTYLYTPASYTGRQIRMLLIDADGEIESSDPYTLAATGWREIIWDLTDSTQINGFTTTEPGFSSGDGVLDTAGGNTRDLGFFGFVIEGGGVGTGSVYLDELAYAYSIPASYKINEFRYSGTTDEFVEIYGPAGSFPAGMQLRLFNGSTVVKTVSLSGSVPNDGGGFGYYVVGDAGVPNVDSTTGFGADDLTDTNPSALQLYNANTGVIYDSVVYKAFGGLSDLIRLENNDVVGEGYPWLGEIGPGLDGAGAAYVHGRYPDGADTNVNANDFSFMRATPGASNGNSIPANTPGVVYDFSTVPTVAFQTYASPTVAAPPVTNNGNALRVVDPAGGGVVAALGDAALGSTGYLNVSGKLYIPSSGAAAQAIGIGICGRQGSTFFTNSPAGSGYESGYWLIYENAAGVGLNDGRPDHAGVFEFVHATNDNMDGSPVTLLGSANLATVSASDNSWVNFELSIDGTTLTAKINGTNVYSGSVPDGGPTTGAFQIGFRENHTSGPGSTEGTWIDDVTIVGSTKVSEWSILE